MAKKVISLITGYDGFVGPYLAERLLNDGRRVYGTVYAGAKTIPHRPKVLEKNVTILPLDLLSRESVRSVVKESRPDEVYHLAGISHVPTSWREPVLTWSTNVMGAIYLFEALRETGKTVRILAVSSAEVYGSLAPKELPATEEMPLRPENPYAASKAALDILTSQWGIYPTLHIVRVRPFSHTGPGQTPDFACPGFAKQVAEISLGKSPPVIKVGDISPRRDFTDVRDVVRAYRMALDGGRRNEVYNVCSGKSRTMRGILLTLKSFCKRKIKIIIDPERLRPVDIPETRGSYARLARATGWRPEIPFTQTLRDLYDYWLAELAD
ncbi:MAG: GDP-mannose 4,6-dehydratase [Candidatus Sumerlaeota bacterium]|nr:GDP-mannose 4,6-dehydratase [Candidatus Sumerlaeota bacterium]